jgi:hypothetical protein
MIDHAVWRELAAMLYERAENANQGPNAPILLTEEAEESPEKPVRGWYDALLPRRNAI